MTFNWTRDNENLDAQDLISWALDRHGQRAAVCTSFQAEGMVILDIACRVDPSVKVFTIDTGRLPQETYDLVDRVRDKYQVDVMVYYPDHNELAQIASEHGLNPFYRSVHLRQRCCEIRKVEPLQRALKDLDVWITGLRASQTATREQSRKIEVDREHGNKLKVNPLSDWTQEQVWDYIRKHNVPYNELYDKGFTSIGCAPCTRATKPGEDERAGRWWWEVDEPKECGLHLSPAQRRSIRSKLKATATRE